MDKPTKPSNLMPRSFGGVKNNWTTSMQSSGYEDGVPAIYGGDNLNYQLDTTGKELDYCEKFADFIRDIPIGKTITVDSNNKLIYDNLSTVARTGSYNDLTNKPTIPSVDNLANKDLSNLTTTGNNKILPTQTGNSGKYLTTNGTNPIWTNFEDKWHALKGYSDEGELLTDSEGLADVTSYAHSTFDLSKFTVVGSPTITADGVASGFSNNRYCTTNNFKISNLLNHSWSVITPVLTGVTSTDYGCHSMQISPVGYSADGAFYFSGTNKTLGFTINTPSNTNPETRANNRISISKTLDVLPEKLQMRVDFNYNIGEYSLYYNIFDGNGWQLAGSITPTTNEKQLYDIIYNNNIEFLFNRRDNNNSNVNELDLKYVNIKVDGVTVFNANQTGVDTYTINGSTVTIPYTLSKTGSKVVDSAYRSQVFAVYNEFGYAPYYTLQENQEENYTIIGSPTISNGIASGFSTDDYISIPFSPAYSAWEIILKTKLNSTGTPILNCGTYSFDLAVAPNVQNRRNKLIINIGNGTTWATTNLLGVTELQTNIDYYIKIKYTGTNYIISLSTDNISWTDEITYTSSTPINSNTLILGKDYLEASALNGSIDLNELTINIEGNNSFKAIQPPDFTLPMGEIYGMLGNRKWHIGQQTLSTATAVGTTQIDLSSILPNDGHYYECLMTYYIISYHSSNVNTDYSIKDNDLNIVYIYDNIDSGASDIKADGGQFTVIAKSDTKLDISIINHNLYTGSQVNILAYRKVDY